ncbi:MAG: hypothetical protein HY350_02295 [Candidatus Omnitrophica bacterium]|nr:hypothetical protein [Candidatus Omnitrophota bacterium]
MLKSRFRILKRIVSGAVSINFRPVVKTGIKINSILTNLAKVATGVKISQIHTLLTRVTTGVGISKTIGELKTRISSGIKINPVMTVIGASVKTGAAVTNNIGVMKMQVASGSRISTVNTGTVQPLVKSGEKVRAYISQGIIGRSKSGINLLQIKYDLTHTSGSNSVSQVAEGGRTDWTSITNAQGLPNGTLTNVQSALDPLNTRGGRLNFAYANFPNKGPLNITSVKLYYYYRKIATLALGGYMRLYWNKGAGDTLVAEHSFSLIETIDKLTTPLEVDITASISNWTDLDNLGASIAVSMSSGVGNSADADAIKLIVLGTITDLL